MAEHLTNRAGALLNALINSSQTTIVVSSTTNFPAPNYRIRIDNELMLVTLATGLTLTVVRGIEGTVATGHGASSKVACVLTAGGLIQYLNENYVHL